jgi:hypothetical protein
MAPQAKAIPVNYADRAILPGTEVMIFKLFSPKKIIEKNWRF